MRHISISIFIKPDKTFEVTTESRDEVKDVEMLDLSQSLVNYFLAGLIEEYEDYTGSTIKYPPEEDISFRAYIEHLRLNML